METHRLFVCDQHRGRKHGIEYGVDFLGKRVHDATGEDKRFSERFVMIWSRFEIVRVLNAVALAELNERYA